jgi:hypothetical protein
MSRHEFESKISPPKTPCRERAGATHLESRNVLNYHNFATDKKWIPDADAKLCKEARDRRETKTLKIRSRGRWREIPQWSHWGTSTCRKAEYLLRTYMALGSHFLEPVIPIKYDGTNPFVNWFHLVLFLWIEQMIWRDGTQVLCLSILEILNA